MIRFDPGLEAHPKIDRMLLNQIQQEGDELLLAPRVQLASARRRADFEWTETKLEQVTDQPNALGLAAGQSLQMFRDLPLVDKEEVKKLCAKLCAGISRLEDLPSQP